MKAQELFERVTADLVAEIEAGAGDWRMPWRRLGAGLPRSVDGRGYRGWNALVLAMVAGDRGWSSARWATYRGWQRHGGQVRRGERGTHVVLWKPTERHDQGEDGADTVHRSLFARTFTVFAAEQVDGADRWLAPVAVADGERIAHADAYFAGLGADVVHSGDRACYVPALDRIHLPELGQFDTPAAYYTTAAREHTHWTGHPDRLARDLSGRFGSDAYGAEQLVAELGAASGPPSSGSSRQPARITPPTSATGYASCAPIPGRSSPRALTRSERSISSTSSPVGPRRPAPKPTTMKR